MTTYPIKIQPGLNNLQGETYTTILRALARQGARTHLTSVTDLTDSSAGVASGSLVITAPATFVDVAASGSNLASKSTTEAALVTVQDALLELATKANAYATKLGLTGITYNGGGTAADGTIGAITVATTGATTGPSAANATIAVTTLNNAVYQIAVLSNKIANATGKSRVTVYAGTHSATVAALTTGTGTAVATGITKVAADAALAQLAANVATLAAHLNAHNDGIGTSLVVAL